MHHTCNNLYHKVFNDAAAVFIHLFVGCGSVVLSSHCLICVIILLVFLSPLCPPAGVEAH